MRLDKLLAHTGYGTRTEVKKLLKSKVVKVDGVIAKDAKQKVDLSKQVVTVFDEVVEYREFVYLMMNKPQNCLSATRDRDYRTVIDLLDDYYLMFDVAPAGRLDRDTEGLVLLTNDGKLAHEIISPKKDVFKRYVAHVTGELTDVSILDDLTVDDYIAFPDDRLSEGMSCERMLGSGGYLSMEESDFKEGFEGDFKEEFNEEVEGEFDEGIESEVIEETESTTISPSSTTSQSASKQ